MIQIRKSDTRGHANHGWLDSRFTFSFAEYFDPKHVEFRTLRVMNDHRLPGRDGSVKVRQGNELYATVLAPGETVKHALQPERHAYVQVARGSVTLNGNKLAIGDGAAISQEKALELTGVEDAEVLLFDLA